MYIFIYMYMYIYTYMSYVYIYMYICIYIYLYVYITYMCILFNKIINRNVKPSISNNKRNSVKIQ